MMTRDDIRAERVRWRCPYCEYEAKPLVAGAECPTCGEPAQCLECGMCRECEADTRTAYERMAEMLARVERGDIYE